MSDQPENKEKKIVVDEDWKSRVEAEKEAAQKAEPASEGAPTGAASGTAGPLPPPDLTFLAGSLYLQGMVALGLLPSPGSEKPEVHLEQAKHTVELLQMLYEKTEGNRTPEETSELDRILHELRLAYVEIQVHAANKP